MKHASWILQALLALLFVFAGSTKLLMSADDLSSFFPLPTLLMRLVGIAELLGGLGLVVPGLLRIRPSLTPLAAIELAHVMLAATIVTIAQGEPVLALMPAVVGCLCTTVAYYRWRIAPHVESAPTWLLRTS